MTGRARRLVSLYAALLSSLCCVGCSRLGDYAAILRGNRSHDLGRYQEALAAYLSVSSGTFAPTVDYNLANVYARLGESEAASELYARSREKGGPELGRLSLYNEGIALYERGRYAEAWTFFRDAIRETMDLGGEDQEFERAARYNLELAWKAWKKAQAAPPRNIVPSTLESGKNPESEFGLLRRFETGRWKPGLRSEPDNAVPDF